MPQQRIYTYTGRTLSWALALAAIGLGLTFLLSNPIRFASPAFQDLLNVPGRQYLWGATWLSAGVTMKILQLLPRRHRLLLSACYFYGAVLSLFFALFFLGTSLSTPNVPFTGIVAYSALGWFYLCFSVSTFALRHVENAKPRTI